MLFKALKPTKYRTRRLLPGDVFEIEDNRDGRLWSALLLAKRHVAVHREPGKIAAPPVELLAKVASDPLDHDGDGKPGGSLSGPNSTVARGRRKKLAE